ncbi:PAS domain S-box protein [Aquicoccus sp. SCR17]|nr:PAS domain S-box protein [Carideicomes alvinocaridis]
MSSVARVYKTISAVCALAGLGTLSVAAWRVSAGTDAQLGADRAELSFVLFSTVALLIAALILSVLAFRHNSRTQERLTGRQRRRLDFQDQILDVHTMTFAWDQDGRFTSVNENFERCFGYPADEIIGQPVASIYHRRHVDSGYVEIARALISNRVWSGEQRMRNRAGDSVYVEMTAAPETDEHGRFAGGTAMMTDVTALRDAESDHFLNAMLEELRDEVFVFDTQTLNIHYMNRAARDRCGWSLDEIRDHRITDTDPNFSEAAMRSHTQPLIDGTKTMVSITVEDRKPTEITTYLFESANGRPLFVAVVRDISDRQAVENARMQSVSVVSHELRAPLTSIKGSLRLLQSGVMGALPQEATAVVDIACRNSDRLLMVVNDILDLDKIQSGKMDFAMTDIDLRVLINDAIEMNKGYADEHNVLLRQELPKGVDLKVRGNADRLMQVMTNLMTNAIKFSPEEDAVAIRVTKAAGAWRVTVADNGPGIPESSRKYLGQPFAQLVAVDGRKRVGTGLGLTIVKSIVKRHNGRFDVNSVVGEGSDFYFEVPAAGQADETRDTGGSVIAAAS